MPDEESAQPAPFAPEPELAPAPPALSAEPAPAPVHAGARRGLAVAIVAAIVLATGGGIGIGWNLARAINPQAGAHASIQTDSPATGGTTSSNPVAAAAKIAPAVVDINSTIQTATATEQAAGTGLIIDSTGDIVTNNHVVAGSISLRVTIEGRSGTYTAEVVGVDPSDDLAVIRI